MEVSNSLFDYYLSMVTVGFFDDHEVPPDDLNEYREIIEAMKWWAIRFDELELLKTVFDYYLCYPEISLEDQGGRYPYTDKDIREIICYARSVIWPDNPPIDDEAVKNVKFVDEPLYDWRKRRNEQSGN